MSGYFYECGDMAVSYPSSDREVGIEFEDLCSYGSIYLNINQLEELLKLCKEKINEKI